MKLRQSGVRWAARILAGAIALATTVPLPRQTEASARTPWWCLVCGDLGMVDVILNLGLFVPIGLALGLGGRRPVGAALVGGGLSLAIESIQFLVPGRDPSLSDVLTNTTGAFLGAMVAHHWRAIALPCPAVDRWLVTVFGALWLTQVAGTAYAVHPALPASIYWGQLAPELAQFERFEGTVTAAGVGSVRLPSAQLRNSEEVRRLLLSGDRLWASVIPGPSTAGLAPIVSIFDGEQREIVLVGRSGNDLVYQMRTHAFDLRLRPPAVRLADGFAAGDARPTFVHGRLSRSPLAFVIGVDSTVAGSRVVPMSANWGWSLLLPFDYAHGSASALLTALWLLGWMAPLGWWAGRALPRTGLPAAVAGLLPVGLVVIPWAAGLRIGWWTEVLPAAAVAVGAGWISRAHLRSANRKPVSGPA